MPRHYDSEDIFSACKASELPELPILGDDFNFYSDRADPLVQEKLHLIKGSNLSTKVYLNQHSVRNFTFLDEPERSLLRENELRLISTCLNELDATLSNAYPELASVPAPGFFDDQSSTDLATMPHLRKHLQSEIQKIVLRTNIINARIYLIEQLLALLGPDEALIATQRGLVIKEMAILLKNVSKASLEPCAKLLVCFPKTCLS
jgi:hypothetical protein